MTLEFTPEAPTAEQIAAHYSAALDSVALLEAGKPVSEFGPAITDEEWADTVARNVAHLEIMVAKDYWTNQNLKPLTDAIAANK